MIAYCGLDCEQCEAFIATATDDEARRERIAREWSKNYNTILKPGDINCTGCRGDGVKLGYCEHGCQIRACALTKPITTCAGCESFGCERLQPVFKAAPQAREQLEQLRRDLHG
jgi:hypothetical protein